MSNARFTHKRQQKRRDVQKHPDALRPPKRTAKPKAKAKGLRGKHKK